VTGCASSASRISLFAPNPEAAQKPESSKTHLIAWIDILLTGFESKPQNFLLNIIIES
jgi:hypothetical protein